MKKLMTLVAVLLTATIAQAGGGGKFMNLKYSLMTGPGVEFGFWKLGLGVGMATGSSSGTSGVDTYSTTFTATNARLAWYSNGLGASSWFIAAAGGTVATTVNQTVSSTAYSATANSSFSGYSLGYHWFWSHFNLGLGFGSTNYNFGDIQVKDANGNVGNTVSIGAFTLPAIDFSLGWAF